MNIRQVMQQDAAEVAALIANDLGLQAGQTDLKDVFYLCERHGGKPLIACEIPGVFGVCYGGGLIIIGGHMSAGEASAVLIHELAHRLCYSERYEYLNSEFAPKRYPKSLFYEYIARAVEQELVKVGGYANAHQHSLDTYPLM